MRLGFWLWDLSFGEIHPPLERLEARVGAPGIKDRITFREKHTATMLSVGLLQPFQPFFFFPQPGIKTCEFIREPLLWRSLQQLVDPSLQEALIAGGFVRVSHCRGPGFIARKFHRRLRLRHRFGIYLHSEQRRQPEPRTSPENLDPSVWFS